MKCNNCQADNAADAKFCVSCGNKFTVEESVVEAQEVAIPEEIVTPNVLEPVRTEPTVPEATLPEVNQTITTSDSKPSKKKSKLPVVLIVVFLIAAIGTAGYVFGKDIIMDMFKTPEERLVDGFFNSMEMRSGEIYSTFLVDDIEINTGDAEMDQMVGSILKDLEVAAMVRFDEKQRRLEGNLDLQMMGASLVGADYYITEEYIILDIPLLYDEPLYWDLYEMLETINESGSMYSMDMPEEPLVDVEAVKESYDRYKDLFDRDAYKSYQELDWTEYKMIMLPYYEEHILEIEEGEFEMTFDSDVTYVGSQYNVEYDYLDNLEISEELIEALVYDENVKAFVEEVITTFIGRVIETQDHIMYGILTEKALEEITKWDSVYQSELEEMQAEAIDQIDDVFDEMELAYMDSQDEISMSMDMDLEDMINDFDIALILGLDEEGYLRSQTYEIEGAIDFGDSMGMMMPSGELVKRMELKVINEYNLINQEVEFEDVGKEDALDIGAMSEEELQGFVMEVQENVMSTFMENPIFNDMFGGFGMGF